MSNEVVQTTVAAATLVVIVVGVTIAVVELRQEVLARRLQAVSALFSEAWTPDVARAAFSIHLDERDPKEDAEEALTDEQARSVPMLLAAYNRLGFLLHQGLLKEREVLGYPPFGILSSELFSKLREAIWTTCPRWAHQHFETTLFGGNTSPVARMPTGEGSVLHDGKHPPL